MAERIDSRKACTGLHLNGPNLIFWNLFDFLLQVTEVDQLPKIMCGECTYKLDLISDFREKAYKTETQLLSKVDVNKVKAEVLS